MTHRGKHLRRVPMPDCGDWEAARRRLGASDEHREAGRGSIAGGEELWPQIALTACPKGASNNRCDAGANSEGLYAVMDDGRHGPPGTWRAVRGPRHEAASRSPERRDLLGRSRIPPGTLAEQRLWPDRP
jgi:hypothetical protein